MQSKVNYLDTLITTWLLRKSVMKAISVVLRVQRRQEFIAHISKTKDCNSLEVSCRCSQLVSSGRCSWKRLHAFFHLHCVHHIARFSMPYTLRHFLTSVRDLRWPDDEADFSMKWLLVDCSSCESNECGSCSIYKHSIPSATAYI